MARATEYFRNSPLYCSYQTILATHQTAKANKTCIVGSWFNLSKTFSRLSWMKKHILPFLHNLLWEYPSNLITVERKHGIWSSLSILSIYYIIYIKIKCKLSQGWPSLILTALLIYCRQLSFDFFTFLFDFKHVFSLGNVII